MKLEVPDVKAEEFEQNLVLSFGLEPDAVDILNYTPEIEFADAFANSVIVTFENLRVPVMDIRDLIKNKESLRRSHEKSLLDQYDVQVLKKILKARERWVAMPKLRHEKIHDQIYRQPRRKEYPGKDLLGSHG